LNKVQAKNNADRKQSLIKMMVRIVIIVFTCELLVMTGFLFFPVENKYSEMFIDSFALSVLISPIIWMFVIRKFENDRDNAVKQLEKNYETMIHVSRMTTLGEVSKGLAHEINNPLQIITGAGQVIAKSSDEKMAMWGNRVTESGRRISKIIKGLLIFTGIEGFQKGKAVAIHEIFADFQDFILSKLEEKSVLLKMTVECSKEIKYDESFLFHLMTNFTQNALEAIDGYQKPVFEIDVFTEANKLVISFSDNGCGILPEIEDKIYEPFFTTKDIGKGTGLGLTLAKGMITKVGGTLDLVSRKDPTTFYITLPL